MTPDVTWFAPAGRARAPAKSVPADGITSAETVYGPVPVLAGFDVGSEQSSPFSPAPTRESGLQTTKLPPGDPLTRR